MKLFTGILTAPLHRPHARFSVIRYASILTRKCHRQTVRLDRRYKDDKALFFHARLFRDSLPPDHPMTSQIMEDNKPLLDDRGRGRET